MRVTNLTRNTEIVTRGMMATSFLARLRGLLGRKALAKGEGLLLCPESSIHTFLMRFPIDVLYLDENNTVIRLTEAMPPQRPGPWVRGTHAVLELPAGTIARQGIVVGDKLAIFDS
ncbi:MAG: DUF192 domain-containing protein [Chloroflexi bacterium]|nr:DUF192 domain-containing protein [Chloroflexota bacterium]